MRHTMFRDLGRPALVVYRIETQSSIYLLAFHESGENRTAVLQGQPGGKNEHVVVRDTDPRIGERSLWTVPPNEWVGYALCLATMTTSPVRSVMRVTDHGLVPAQTLLTLASATAPQARSPSAPAAPPVIRPTIPLANLAQPPAPREPVATGGPSESPPPSASRGTSGPYRTPDAVEQAAGRLAGRAIDAVYAIEVTATFLRGLGADTELRGHLGRDADVRERYAKALMALADATEALRGPH